MYFQTNHHLKLLIKDKNYAKKVHHNVKIKLNYDSQTKAATAVVKCIYLYLSKKELIQSVNTLNELHNKPLKATLEKLSKHNANVAWLFYTDEELSSIRQCYYTASDILNNSFVPTIASLIKENSKKKRPTIKSVWEHFSANSIDYYNTIDTLCPGVLGDDSSIYGLPEELARNIQDECFFPDGLLCQLRKYQEWGVKYILHQERVLLGDEMGLGKTIQAIATMVSLKNTGATHFLVVCPASVITNWCREITKHSKLRVTKVHGTGKAASVKSWIKHGGVAVTNFETTSHFKFEENFKFSLAVIDEAHYIKNEKAKRSINTRALTNYADRVLFMTGTALENNVDEMISLIDVLNPEIGAIIRDSAFMVAAPEFRKKVAPVYYRRKREQVLSELPDKIETREWCTLTPEEEDLYEEAILNKQFQEARRVSWNIDNLEKSTKATRLKEIVAEAKAEGRKVLVFSYFLDTLNKIHSLLRDQCLNPINGSINVNRRQAILDEFEQAPAGTVLLAQITSGGTGLNIQAASVVVICEPQFKPSIENQAIARAYRMGQSRNVLVYRLLCVNTIDERMTELLEQKQQIFDAFADESVAAKEVEVDETTYRDLIADEIKRIIEKRQREGTPIPENLITTLSATESQKSNPATNSKEYYYQIMNLSYAELVELLLKKYGRAMHSYFTDESCTRKNRKVSRTNEGLYCHHIDENQYSWLSNENYAKNYPFQHQLASRLVYCNYLEHVLLHILIFEESTQDTEKHNILLGVNGLCAFMIKQLNDLYNGYEFKLEWMKKTTSVIANDYDIYLALLNRLWNDIQDQGLTIIIPKEDLCKGWDNTFYPKIFNDID